MTMQIPSKHSHIVICVAVIYSQESDIHQTVISYAYSYDTGVVMTMHYMHYSDHINKLYIA